MSTKISNGIDKQELHLHFYKTLRKYNITKSGLSLQLNYNNNSWKNKLVFMDHDYVKDTHNFYNSAVLAKKGPSVKEIHPTSSISPYSTQEKSTLEHETNDSHRLMYNNNIEISQLLKTIKEKEYKIKLPVYKKVCPQGFNYLPVVQGADQWLSLRVGKITASKLPSLLRFSGHNQFSQSWFCIHNHLDESKVAPKKFKNFTRGKEFEGKAIELFEEMTG